MMKETVSGGKITSLYPLLNDEDYCNVLMYIYLRLILISPDVIDSMMRNGR